MVDSAEFPLDGTLIEWNTAKQVFSLNQIRLGICELPPYRPETAVVWICQSQKAAEWIVRLLNAKRQETDGAPEGVVLDAAGVHGLIYELLHPDSDIQHASGKESEDFSIRTFGSVTQYAKQMTIDRRGIPAVGDLVAVEHADQEISIERYDGSQQSYATVMRWTGEESLPGL